MRRPTDEAIFRDALSGFPDIQVPITLYDTGDVDDDGLLFAETGHDMTGVG